MWFLCNFYFRRLIKAFCFGSADKRALAVCVLDESLVTVCCNNDCSFTIMEHASLGATFTSNTRQMNSPYLPSFEDAPNLKPTTRERNYKPEYMPSINGVNTYSRVPIRRDVRNIRHGSTLASCIVPRPVEFS